MTRHKKIEVDRTVRVVRHHDTAPTAWAWLLVLVGVLVVLGSCAGIRHKSASGSPTPAAPPITQGADHAEAH